MPNTPPFPRVFAPAQNPPFPLPFPSRPSKWPTMTDPLLFKKSSIISEKLITVLTDILWQYGGMMVWMKLWGKICGSFTVYYDQGDKPKNILLFLVVFNIHVFSFMVQKKSLMMLKIHLKKWTVLTLMALTIVPVKVTMLDPFSHARTWMRT